jgi:hypothetical protein
LFQNLKTSAGPTFRPSAMVEGSVVSDSIINIPPTLEKPPTSKGGEKKQTGQGYYDSKSFCRKDINADGGGCRT